jgi:hypothetical protein
MYVPKMTTYSPNIYVFVYDVPPIFDQYSTAVNLFQKFQVILFTPSRHHKGPFTLEEEELWAEGGEPPAGRSER